MNAEHLLRGEQGGIVVQHLSLPQEFTPDVLAKSLKNKLLSFLRKQESSIFKLLEFAGFPFSRE
jgi:hypothetical protein